MEKFCENLLVINYKFMIYIYITHVYTVSCLKSDL